jgi:glycosyltransferase involved in cell wall biosynthesis
MYNSSRFLEDCIKSISNQTFRDFEVVFVDDASKDNSFELARTLCEKYKIQNTIFLKHDKNTEYGKSLKDAIDQSSGDLIAIVDSDDALASKDALKIMFKTHKKYPNCSLAYSKYYICNSKLKVLKEGNTLDLRGRTFLEVRKGISHLKTFKMSYYKKTQGVDENLRKCVDKDLVLKLEEVGDLVFVDKFLYFYREHGSSITSYFCKKGRRSLANKWRNKIFRNAEKRRLFAV